MPRGVPQTSQAVFFMALEARGRLGIKAVVPNSLLPFSFPVASAQLNSSLLGSNFFCHHLVLCVVKERRIGCLCVFLLQLPLQKDP